MRVTKNNVTIISNGHLYQTQCYWDLPKKEQAFFDYEGAQDASYVKYRGVWYDIGEFHNIPASITAFAGWAGYYSDSFFSGVLVKPDEDNDWDYVKMAWYCS